MAMTRTIIVWLVLSLLVAVNPDAAAFAAVMAALAAGMWVVGCGIERAWEAVRRRCGWRRRWDWS